MITHNLKNGNNVPLHSPLFNDPFVPYRCPGNATLSAYCRGDRSKLSAHLENTPFELASDIFLVYVSDFTNCDKAAFMDAGIMLSITYKGRPGGYVLYEYENDDAAMAAGRELWGYPKKFAEINLEVGPSKASGEVIRKGVKIIEINLDFSRTTTTPPLRLTPHFNVKITPGPDGSIESRKIIERDTSPDFVATSLQVGEGHTILRGTPFDPFDLLGSFEPMGASFLVGDFLSSEKNGWGKVVETF